MNPWDFLLADLTTRRNQIQKAIDLLTDCRSLAEGAKQPDVCMVSLSKSIFRTAAMERNDQNAGLPPIEDFGDHSENVISSLQKRAMKLGDD